MEKWHVLYTKPGWERRIAGLFERRSFETYCPLLITHSLFGYRKDKGIPLFPSYVFARIPETEHPTIRQTEGVLGLVYWLSSPLVLPPEEIAAIKRFLDIHVAVTLQKTMVDAGERPQFLPGRLWLPSLGYTLIAVEKVLFNYEQSIYHSRASLSAASHTNDPAAG